MLYAAKTEIDAILLRLSNLSCVYSLVSTHFKDDYGDKIQL